MSNMSQTQDLIHQAKQLGYRPGITVLLGISRLPTTIPQGEIQCDYKALIDKKRLRIGHVVIWREEVGWTPIADKDQMQLRLEALEQSIAEMKSPQTTFDMFVAPRNVDRLIRALELVNQDKSMSYQYRTEHSVTYQRKPLTRPDQCWFTITVSRPFLIFKIGEKYNSLRR